MLLSLRSYINFLFAFSLIAGSLATCAQEKGEKTGEDVVVKLIDAGKEPRAKLLYDVKAGDKFGMVMKMQVTMEMEMNDQKLPPQAMPGTKMEFASLIKSVNPSGDIAYESEITGADIEGDDDSPIAAGMKQAISSIKGTKVTGVVTSSGAFKEGNVETSDKLNPMLKNQLEQTKQQMRSFTVPLPSEPVGVGAKWTGTSNMESNGMKMKQIATYTVKEKKGSLVSLSVSIEQSAPKQEMKPPGLPANAKIELQSLEGKASGTSVIDLSKMTVQGDLNMNTDMEMDVSGTGQDQTMKMNMKVSMKIEPK